MDSSPLLGMLIVWLLIGIPLSALSKKAKMKQNVNNAKAKAARTAAPAAPKKPTLQRPAGVPVPETNEGSFFRSTVMQPTITITEHDDSVYQGSMNAETGEGYDPCHDEQMEPLTLAETAVPAAETEVPGLQLNWNGSEVVRGIVMSEILKRRA